MACGCRKNKDLGRKQPPLTISVPENKTTGVKSHKTVERIIEKIKETHKKSLI